MSVTRVDFYILAQTNTGNRDLVACRLVEKAYKLGRKVYIHTDSPEQAQRLDDLLWTFRPGSFVPHAQHPASSADGEVAVLIGHDTPPEHDSDVLINLSAAVPAFFSRFERVAELVDQSEEHKSLAREHFRFYRDRGYDLHTHNL